MKIAGILSDMGGGKEIFMFYLFNFFYCSREKFFYALLLNVLVTVNAGYMKLAYANPRPYMIDGEIQPFECDT